jgi:hypothetical protein
VELVAARSPAQAQDACRRGVSPAYVVRARGSRGRGGRYAVVFISNQGIKPDKLVDWKRKIPLSAAAVCPGPLRSRA